MKHLLLLLTIATINFELHAQLPSQIQNYNLSWNSPSKNASESMAVGGGDIGCNIWVENGDILLYMQRSGCFSENGEYLKLGRVRLFLSPNPFKRLKEFKQELILDDGYVTILGQGRTPKTDFEVRLNVWVDRLTHSIHFDIESEKEIKIKASYENWQTKDKLLPNKNRDRFGCFGLEGYPGEVVKQKDNIEFIGNSIQFYHRNGAKTLSPDVMIEQQGLEEFKDQIVNNIRHLTFGSAAGLLQIHSS